MEEQLQKVATKEKIKPSPAKRIEEPKILMVEDNFVAQKLKRHCLRNCNARLISQTQEIKR